LSEISGIYILFVILYLIVVQLLLLLLFFGHKFPQKINNDFKDFYIYEKEYRYYTYMHIANVN